MNHGSYSTYKSGCRCPECTEDNRRYVAQRRVRLRGTPPPTHGTFEAYTLHGCRCPVCANSESVVKYKERSSRTRYVGSKYKLSRDDFEILLDSQGGACAICDGTITATTAVIDHDHACCSTYTTCGLCVRGLLCRNCNTALGKFGDSTSTILKAVRYLR